MICGCMCSVCSFKFDKIVILVSVCTAIFYLGHKIRVGLNSVDSPGQAVCVSLVALAGRASEDWPERAASFPVAHPGIVSQS